MVTSIFLQCFNSFFFFYFVVVNDVGDLNSCEMQDEQPLLD